MSGKFGILLKVREIQEKSGKFKKINISLEVAVINWHIQKFSARAFGAHIIFFNILHSKFPFIYKDLLFETYTGHVQNNY